MSSDTPPDNSVSLTGAPKQDKSVVVGCLLAVVVTFAVLSPFFGLVLLIAECSHKSPPRAPTPPPKLERAEFTYKTGTVDSIFTQPLVFTGGKLDIRVFNSESEVPSSRTPPVHFMRGEIDVKFTDLTQNLSVTAIGINSITSHIGLEFSNAAQAPPKLSTIVVIGSINCMALPDLHEKAKLAGYIKNLGPSANEMKEYGEEVSRYHGELERYHKKLSEYNDYISKKSGRGREVEKPKHK